ncbi:MAG: hypothetical protein WKG06_28610 [Segetibacter sp.]
MLLFLVFPCLLRPGLLQNILYHFTVKQERFQPILILRQRFGSWARTYTVICFLLTQLARMGSIFFGIALSLQALVGYPMSTIMIVMGICIILYTVLGGMEAVIWTEVIQGVIKTIGRFSHPLFNY